MPFVTTSDGVRLHYESEGDGPALVFAHEFGGDARSWASQVAHFAPRYRCLTFDARGYPPSDVPSDPSSYSLERATDDLRELLDALGIDRAHLVGLSMGSFTVLHTGLRWPARVASIVVAGTGYGSHPGITERFRADMARNADGIRERGMEWFAETWGRGPTRIQLEEKDPSGFAAHLGDLAGHSAVGSANTMSEIQGKRPSYYDLVDELRALRTPTLLVAGDEDDLALEASIYLKRCIDPAGLAILPKTGHLVNLEDPPRFNALVDDFLSAVAAGSWRARRDDAAPSSIWGPAGQPS
jgi:pimeloyl-ACP methyl ester carboxylesterase